MRNNFKKSCYCDKRPESESVPDCRDSAHIKRMIVKHFNNSFECGKAFRKWVPKLLSTDIKHTHEPISK